MGYRVRLGAGSRHLGVAESPVPNITRRDRAVQALVAAGETVPGPLPTYEMTLGSEAGLRFHQEAFRAGFDEHSGASWPCETPPADNAAVIFREDNDVVYRLRDGTLVHAVFRYGWLHLHFAAGHRENIAGALAAFRDEYPALYFIDGNRNEVPITFWMFGQHGPTSRLRKIEASPWEAIRSNYTAAVRDQLDAMMDGFDPGADGQLLLWQGSPGTGKTWALRALAAEWAPWAEFHYITDPDAFFVEKPSYMIDVLLADSYSTVEEASGDIYETADPEGKWRILILEDTGELLAANAKESYGQGLSRLLNVVDGMVGQGLRVLVLVTTNDELGMLHPAVARPGRCAVQLEFVPFTAEETSEWLGEPVEDGLTIAELYARRAQEPPGDAAAATEGDVRAEVARVAADVQDAAEGYGETAWNSDTRTVLYIAGDWTEVDQIEEAFLAIPGVEKFVSEAEALPSGWWDAEVVYPDDPPAWVVDPDLALEAIVQFARRPL